MTSAGVDWQREKWQSGFGSKFIRQGEKNAVKYADEIIVLSKGVQDYFKETYGRETHFIPNGVNRPQIREANLITDVCNRKMLTASCAAQERTPRAEGCARSLFSTNNRAAAIIIRCSGYSRRIFLKEKAMADRSPGAVRGRS